MNERIKELYIQTANETADGKEWAIGGLINVEKFAELIMRDLIDSMIKRYGGDDELPIEEIKLFVKEHFGV